MNDRHGAGIEPRPISDAPEHTTGASQASPPLPVAKGLPVSKRARILSALSDPWLARLSDAEIARRIHVSGQYTGQVRQIAPDLRPRLPADNRLRMVRRGATEYLMDTEGLRR
jgi:hypothetical protein